MNFNAIETQIRLTLDRLSNGEPVPVEDEWIEQAAEDFKQALYKQFKPKERTFGLRASNIGRPLCQLQHEQLGTEGKARDYNHILRMTIGDAVEAITTLVIKAAGINITNSKERVSHEVNDSYIPGENDIEIEDKIYDIKSASSYSFNHKWEGGWEGLFHTDTFGYVEQLYVYAGGNAERMGGWIVIDKSSGEIKVVEARPTPEQMKTIASRIERNERAIVTNEPFRKVFEEEEEVFRRKPTGNKIVPKVCEFCDYMHSCWPDAKRLPQIASQSQTPKIVWYTEVVNE